MSDTRYIAIDDIFAAPGVRAFRKGDVVPAENVESLDARDKVAGEATKVAKEAVKDAVKES